MSRSLEKKCESFQIDPTTIPVIPASGGLQPEALRLAERYSLEPLGDHASEVGLDVFLLLTPERLELHVPVLADFKPLWVDFSSGEFFHRLSHGGAKNIHKAMGLRKMTRPSVVDATGGLGRDSFLVASAGCNVLVFERNPVVAALLEDGLIRAGQHPQTKAIAQCITIEFNDSSTWLQQAATSDNKPDIVYLDPMFPKRAKSAKVKKDLQTIQFLVGLQTDEKELFQLALKAASKRVVVKRPQKTEPITTLRPSHSIEGKTTRFDVYLVG